MMESHTSVTLFLLLLCLSFSVGGARLLAASDDDASPTPKAAESSRLAPGASPTGGPAASPFASEDFSFESAPEGSVAMKDLAAQLNGPFANDAVNEAVKYVSQLDVLPPTESVRNELAPAASAVMDKAAALGPAASTAMHKASAALAPAASTAKDKVAALGPAASAAMNKAAAWAAELKGPSPN